MYTKRNKFWHPYLINTIEMRSLWMEIKYIISTVRLLNRVWVNKGGLDLSKKVLWVSVGQRAADLRAVKVGGHQKILPISPLQAKRVRTGPIGRIFFNPIYHVRCWSSTPHIATAGCGHFELSKYSPKRKLYEKNSYFNRDLNLGPQKLLIFNLMPYH